MRLNSEVQRNVTTQVSGQVAGRPEITTTNRGRFGETRPCSHLTSQKGSSGTMVPCYLVTMVNIVTLYHFGFVRTLSLQLYNHVPFHSYRGLV